MIVYEGNYAYGIHYPTIGIDEIDNIIKNTVDSFASDFISVLDGYKAYKDDDIAILTADYRTYLISDQSGDKYVSLVFKLSTDIPRKYTHTEKIRTVFFDLDDKKALQFTDVFKDGSQTAISKQVVSYFKNNRLYSSNTVSDLFRQNTAAKSENFQSFAINGGNVIFYFDSGRIFNSDEGCVEAVIPIEDLKNHISEDIFNAVTGAKKEPATQITTDSPPDANQENAQVSIPSGSKFIAFTFDDGPHETVTPRILDTLEKTNSHATFFVLGTRAGSYADIIKRAHALGCEIGNHSYSHPKLRRLNTADRMNEINKTNKLIREITGTTPKLFRVPYGDFKGIEESINMPLIQWSIDTKDWKYKSSADAQREKDKQKIVSAVLDNVSGGEIVLMHDLYDLTAEAFEEIVPELIKRGFILVTVSELYDIYGIELQPCTVYRTPKRDNQTNETPK